MLFKQANQDEDLGFQISGGFDRPYFDESFISIVVVNIYVDSLAHRDGRLK